jgi:hypothetical protein
MRIIKPGFLCCLLVLLLTVDIITARAGTQPTIEKLLSAREQLTFSVHYGFLTLGHVYITAIYDTLYNGSPAHTFTTIIKSNPSIPFVGNKERHFHSIFKHVDGQLYGLNFWTDNVDSKEFLDSRYIFDYDARSVYVFEFEEPVDTLYLDRAADSGPLLFLITRLYAGLNERVDYPIYISNEHGDVSMDFTSRIDRLNVPAFGQVDAYFSSGNANVKGPFGFSGFYRAWHKKDDLRIPLEAHVRVWVGNVRVRLQEFERIYD